jgi:hypothetical protein
MHSILYRKGEEKFVIRWAAEPGTRKLLTLQSEDGVDVIPNADKTLLAVELVTE